MAQVVDTHVHLFDRQFGFAPRRRYAPEYDALPDELDLEMRGVGVSGAVVVQPSFLGTDNSYLLWAIGQSGGTYHGIAVVDPGIHRNELARLQASGIVGIRLNMIGDAPPDLTAHPYTTLTANLADLGMVLQIQAEGRQWCDLGAALATCPATVLIDHFGRTPPRDAGGGFECLLRAAEKSDRICFKFSAPYRLKPGGSCRGSGGNLKAA